MSNQHLPVYTFDALPGYRIAQVHGLVRAAKEVGGSTGAPVSAAVFSAVERISVKLHNATREIGGNAVLGVKFEITPMPGQRTLVFGYGNAVTLELER